ncbi:MAG: futalosine hydrolase [Planctomycetota bacterium]|nr:futalosine hydrolase [Planctomycetota bacterium]
MTTLLLTPTQLERRTLEPLLSPSGRRADSVLELCGFGPVAAASRTMQLIAVHQPAQVILVGIAGALRPELEVGTARSFRQVTCVGIGVGTGANHKSVGEIGWKHWVSAGSAGDEPEAGIGDVMPLAPNLTDPTELGGELLTVCAASANESDAALRLARHPDATAEDMEGFGVAVACYFGGVRLQIIRGISNRAGDRDKRNWNIDGALHAASALTLKTLSV